MIGKVIEVIDFPFKIIRNYTIMPCNEEEYDHHYCIYWPILGIPTILLLLGHKPSW